MAPPQTPTKRPPDDGGDDDDDAGRWPRSGPGRDRECSVSPATPPHAQQIREGIGLFAGTGGSSGRSRPSHGSLGGSIDYQFRDSGAHRDEDSSDEELPQHNSRRRGARSLLAEPEDGAWMFDEALAAAQAPLAAPWPGDDARGLGRVLMSAVLRAGLARMRMAGQRLLALRRVRCMPCNPEEMEQAIAAVLPGSRVVSQQQGQVRRQLVVQTPGAEPILLSEGACRTLSSAPWLSVMACETEVRPPVVVL